MIETIIILCVLFFFGFVGWKLYGLYQLWQKAKSAKEYLGIALSLAKRRLDERKNITKL